MESAVIDGGLSGSVVEAVVAASIPSGGIEPAGVNPALAAEGISAREEVKSESSLKVGNEGDGESREVARCPSQIPALVQEESYPCPGGYVDSGGRT